MKICVCGGRNYAEYKVLSKVLNEARQIYGTFTLVHGDARGADTMAKNWAISHEVEYIAYPAQWDEFGNAAGYIRNRQMLEQGFDLLIAFPGGRGTANMISITNQAGIPVLEIG